MTTSFILGAISVTWLYMGLALAVLGAALADEWSAGTRLLVVCILLALGFGFASLLAHEFGTTSYRSITWHTE